MASGREENLKPWAKAISGNPGGRSRTAPITELLRELLEKPYPGDKQNRTYAHKIAEAMLKRACEGDVGAAREVADRTEGRPTQSVIVGGECENCRENREQMFNFPFVISHQQPNLILFPAAMENRTTVPNMT